VAHNPHETLHRVFQEDPTLFARALERALGVEFPPIRAVSVVNTDLTEVKPLARWVDTPLLVESDAGDRFMVIIESQCSGGFRRRLIRWCWRRTTYRRSMTRSGSAKT
jgi:hypothetical protein